MSQHVRIAVIGAGLVGAAAALALSRAGFSVALIERGLPPPPSDDWDARVYAIAPASQQFLESLGVWQMISASRLGPIYRMDVSGDAHGLLRLDAYETGVPRLATIVESGRLQRALWSALVDDAHVALHCPASLKTIDWGEPHSTLMLADGQKIVAELVVAADGIDSQVRELTGLPSKKTAYGQHGIVANFACERPHRGTAFEWFAGDGNIVAWLPLGSAEHGSDNVVSLVWSADSTLAASQLALPPDDFARYARDRVASCLNAAANGKPPRQTLGELTLLGTPRAFPLQLMHVPRVVAPGVVLIGDAAHSVHPLAGQGVNLGFGDVSSLVATLGDARRTRLGDPRVLARHERLRAEPVALMQAATDGLYHLFANSRPQGLRNVGMTLVNHLHPLKTVLIRHALN